MQGNPSRNIATASSKADALELSPSKVKLARQTRDALALSGCPSEGRLLQLCTYLQWTNSLSLTPSP